MSLVMRNLVDDTLKSSSTKMTEMAEMLDITKREQLKILTSVADEMFEDQQVDMLFYLYQRLCVKIFFFLIS